MKGVYLLLLFLSFLKKSIVVGQRCNASDTFIKVHSFIPNENNTVLLFNNPDNAVTAECQRRCLASSNCNGFLVDYTQASCFRALNVSINSHPVDTDVESNFFLRSCLNLPANCTTRLWSLERVDGFEIIGFEQAIYPNVRSGIDCAQLCLSEDKFECRSAKYYSDKKQCSLSSEDRRTQPSAYRASDWSIQYWENQCLSSSFPEENCSLEEYANSTIIFADEKQENLTQYQCQKQCYNETIFNCRGFTYIPAGGPRDVSNCLLHGDDTSSIGPRGVQPLAGASYWERVPCLPIQVTCTMTGMNVILRSQDFRGRMYVLGKSDKCSTQGRQGRDAILKIPLWREGKEINECGVMVARSIGESNRTLVSAVVVIQYNAIIQRQGDRAVKVGCLVENSSLKNMSLGVSLSFASSNSGTQGGTTVLNSSDIPPTVSLRILDRSNENEELNEVVLGQSLEFRVDVEPDNSTYDILVFKLVASNGDGTQSYFLLDQQGCPSDPQTFSALRKVNPGSRSLIGDFKAFKFPYSDVVRFEATVHFCLNTCPPAECNGGVISYGKRRRRQVPTPYSSFEELPVQLAVVVRVSDTESSPLIASTGENNSTIIYAENIPDYVCISWGALLGTILAFILLQFAILGTWFFVLHYRRQPKFQDETKLQDDFAEYDNRHVHWADT